MKKFLTYISFSLFTCFLFSCKSELRTDKESILKKIQSLESNDLKKEYLENIFFEYQLILTEEEQVVRQFGYDSPEYEKQQNQKAKKDDYFLNSTVGYFNTFGYPERSKLGQYASIAPLIVHYYAAENKGFKKEHFKYFYGAFKFNDIPQEYFLAYLQSYYEFNEGKTFLKKNKMGVSEEIYAIMDALDIDY